MNTLNRTESIRAYCLDCTAGSYSTIRDCSFSDCHLFPLRMGKTPKGMTKNVVIRNHCRSCAGEAPSRCQKHDCSLYAFRTGTRTENASICQIFTKHEYKLAGRTCMGMANLRSQVEVSE